MDTGESPVVVRQGNTTPGDEFAVGVSFLSCLKLSIGRTLRYGVLTDGVETQPGTSVRATTSREGGVAAAIGSNTVSRGSI